MGSLCLVLERGWELPEVGALAPCRDGIPSASQQGQCSLTSAGLGPAPGLEQELGLGTFHWELEDEAFWKNSLAPSCSSYFY